MAESETHTKAGKQESKLKQTKAGKQTASKPRYAATDKALRNKRRLFTRFSPSWQKFYFCYHDACLPGFHQWHIFLFFTFFLFLIFQFFFCSFFIF
jgi:hypothetical protein